MRFDGYVDGDGEGLVLWVVLLSWFFQSIK